MTHGGARLEVVETLGSTALVALDRCRGRRVVVKEGSRAELSRELELCLRLHHPAFRRTYGWAGERALFEYIEGGPPADLFAFAEGLLRALVCLHSHGFAHGDIKPDNVLVSEGQVRLIDLGMARPLGELPVGGTPDYLAPELVAGDSLSVATDLFAFGKTVLAYAPDGVVASLANQCVQPDATRRPASAGSALAMLGVSARPIDRLGERERLLRPVLAPVAAVSVFEGEVSERAEEVLFGEHFRGGGEALILRFEPGVEPLVALAEPRSPDPWAEASLENRVVARFSASNVAVVVRASSCVDEEARVVLCALVRTALALERTLVILDAPKGLAQVLAAAGAEHHVAPRYDRERGEELARACGATLDDASIDALVDIAASGPALESLIMRAADDPTLRFEDLIRAPDAPHTERKSTTKLENRSAAQLRAHAVRALAAGAGRRALRYLDAIAMSSASGGQPAEPSMRAQALALSGDLRGACAVPPRDIAGRLRRSEWMLRIADFKNADAEAQEVLALLEKSATVDSARETPDIQARALCVRAQAARDTGTFVDARSLAIQALAAATTASGRFRAALLEADIAGAQGDAEGALAIAERSRDLADSERANAEVEARVGGALAALGRWDDAAEAYQRARTHARQAGDPQGLPVYELNCATAHHALGRYGEALAGYESAAYLARTLDRVVTVAAALTNLASLYVSLACLPEARMALARAREACERSGYALYAAQCDLIEAETHRAEPSRGLRWVKQARAAFQALGATQQAMEAALLWNELSLGASPAETEDVPGLEERRLRAAGLGGRVALHQAHRAERDGAWDTALTLAERAVSESDDPAQRLRARALHIRCLTRLRPSEVEAAEETLRAERDAVANTLPPGLRRRFLPDPFEGGPRTTGDGLGEAARRLIALSRRVLLEPDESRVLRAALDEAVAITGAERAFLLRRGPRGAHHVLAARNLDGESVKRSRERFSRSIVERVFETGESALVAQANEDPDLAGVRSVHEMGLRSVLCVPVFSPRAIVGVIYLDHRFASAAFGPHEREWLTALGDVLGLALENARLQRAAAARAEALEREARDVRRVNERQAMQIARLQNNLAAPGAEHGILGHSPAILDALHLATKVAPSTLPVLIHGESGTGKELFARLIHERSERATGPLLAINCGAMTESLLESELFGHVRGAFTGALRDHPGLFRSAEGGTLFLDEIGEMPLRMQARLLRVLQESEVRPVGASAMVKVDVRIVAATNRALRAQSEAGNFRPDLYYRLAGVELELPALRDRRQDLPDLVAGLMESKGRRLSSDAMRALLEYDFPGNVRELKQMLERAQLVAGGEHIEARDLFPRAASTVSRDKAHAELDRSLIVAALRDAGGNKSKAARDLGVSRMTLYRWIDRAGLSDVNPR